MNFLAKIKENKAAYVAEHGGLTHVFTDGGCQTQPPHIGAWAYSVQPIGHKSFHAFGALADTTNNRMELLAIYKALEELEIGPPIRLHSDSMYAINCATAWGLGWIKNDWMTADGKPVKNRDLIEPLVILVRLHSIEFRHVNGHATSVGNYFVDGLCVSAIAKAHKQWKGDASLVSTDSHGGETQ